MFYKIILFFLVSIGSMQAIESDLVSISVNNEQSMILVKSKSKAISQFEFNIQSRYSAYHPVISSRPVINYDKQSDNGDGSWETRYSKTLRLPYLGVWGINITVKFTRDLFLENILVREESITIPADYNSDSFKAKIRKFIQQNVGWKEYKSWESELGLDEIILKEMPELGIKGDVLGSDILGFYAPTEDKDKTYRCLFQKGNSINFATVMHGKVDKVYDVIMYKVNREMKRGAVSRWIDLNNDKQKQDDEIFYLWY